MIIIMVIWFLVGGLASYLLLRNCFNNQCITRMDIIFSVFILLAGGAGLIAVLVIMGLDTEWVNKCVWNKDDSKRT